MYGTLLQGMSSPSLMSKDVLMRLVPEWDKMIRVLAGDSASAAVLDWQLETYAFNFALGVLLNRTPLTLQYHRELMAEPPYFNDLEIDTCRSLYGMEVRTPMLPFYRTIGLATPQTNVVIKKILSRSKCPKISFLRL